MTDMFDQREMRWCAKKRPHESDGVPGQTEGNFVPYQGCQVESFGFFAILPIRE